MKLALHLIRADIWHFRFVLIGWVVVALGLVFVDGARPYVAVDPRLREAAAVAGSLFWFAQVLLLFALVSLVIHAHPTVGTTAFWMTRPIAPGLLLAAKLVLLATTLVIVPAMADAVLLATYRVPTDIAAGVVSQRAGIQLLIMLLLIVAAALTPNLARFAMLCGSVVVLFATAMGIAIAVEMAREDNWVPRIDDVTDATTEMFVFNVLFVGAAIVLLVVQYRTRLRRRSVPVGIAAVLTANLVSSVWPFPFLAPRRLVPAWAQDERTMSVAVAGDDVFTVVTPPFYQGRESRQSYVRGRVRIEGVPDGWSASFSVRDATLQLPDGTLRSLRTGTASLQVGVRGSELPPAIVEPLLDVRVLRDPQPPEPEARATLFTTDRSEVARRGIARGDYRATVRIPLTSYIVDGVVPLRAGTVHATGGYRLVIERITPRDGELRILARESRASSVWQRRPWSMYAYYLRNRARGEAINVVDFDLYDRSSFGRFLPQFGFAHFSIGTSESGGFFARGIALGQPPWLAKRLDDPAWMADAELVIIRRTEEGSVDRALHIPGFPLGIVDGRATSSR